jgi:hypothetical protein
MASISVSGSGWSSLNSELLENFFKPLIGNKDITIRYINPLRGRGVFAKRDFLKGTLTNRKAFMNSFS